MKTVVLAGGSADVGGTIYAKAARAFGRGVAKAGWTLRTGGGAGSSVMGEATDGALEAGGRVEAVILGKFWGVRHRGVERMRSVRTFAERKAGLFRGADAAVVFPGGVGTLDELGDLLCLKQTGFLRISVAILNLDGYYGALLAWLRRAEREGFLGEPRLYRVVASVNALVRGLR